MNGFIPELIHPSQVATDVVRSSFQTQSTQIPDKGFRMKNGNQQIMNTPITMPNVLAAFFSFANFVILRLKEKFLCMDFACITRFAELPDGCRDKPLPLHELNELFS